MRQRGWLRSLRRECWELVPDWRQVHNFMSMQALGLGTTILTVLIAVGADDWMLLAVLFVTVAATLAGALIKQPELED